MSTTNKIKNKKNKKGIARLLEIAGQKKSLLILSGTLASVSAAAMLVPYLSVYKILEELLQNAADITHINAVLMKSWAWIALIGLAVGLVTLYASLMASHVAAFNILYGLRIKISEHIAKLPLGFITSSSTGAIKKTMEQNVEKTETFIAHTIPDFVGVIASLILMFIVFFSLNVWLALVCLVVIGVSLYLQFSIFFGKNAAKIVKTYYDTQESLSASAVEYVRGMPVVKIFSKSVNSFKDFTRQINNYKRLAIQMCDLYEKPMMRFVVGLNSVVAFILPFGILLFNHSASAISFAVVWLFFLIMSPGLASPVFKLMYLGSSTKEIDEGVQRIDKILSIKPNPETSNPQLPKDYDIKFENVCFSYNQDMKTEDYTLKNINITAEKGKITALVGASGSGKSTLASLIPRFYDVNAGAILIGGVNIKDIAGVQLMNMVSFVFQDTFLFLDTIANNISVGQNPANIERIIDSAKKAQCHEFIMSLPDGYQTKIGDKGVNLSGGERQRICLARAIMKNAPILILDEATAFADTENEQLIQKAINNLVKDKTVIMIAHRLSTIKRADKIVVLDGGKIAQEGNHSSLLQTEGIYKNMWEAYSQSQQWKIMN